jgi:hypothetical protein
MADLKCNQSWERWKVVLEAAGCDVRLVDVRQSDILDQVRGCTGFMWRWEWFAGMRQIASRLFPVLERELGIVCYPNRDTCWHYDDKVSQAFLFEALRIPTPRTWVFFDRNTVLTWLRHAIFPLVVKLAGGAAAANVAIVRSVEEAVPIVESLFHRGLWGLDARNTNPMTVWSRLAHAGWLTLTGRMHDSWYAGQSLERGYVMFQEFLPGNDFDTRITVIGNRAFGFRRFNRDRDFRASGSGKIDHTPAAVDPAMIRLAFATAHRLRMQSCAIDGLYRDGRPVVCEVSYTYVSWAVHACPGHWTLAGDPEGGELSWVEGHVWPEVAQATDFLQLLDKPSDRVLGPRGRDPV